MKSKHVLVDTDTIPQCLGLKAVQYVGQWDLCCS